MTGHKSESLRHLIKSEMKQRKMSLSMLANHSGINRGALSKTLNSQPPDPMPFNQLEQITKVFGEPEDWLFEYYIDECFYHGKPNKRRVEPFLIRCGEVGRKDCIDTVLARLVESEFESSDILFDVAEYLYTSGNVEATLNIYETIIQHEKSKDSEKIAISHYRLFRARLSDKHEVNRFAINCRITID